MTGYAILRVAKRKTNSAAGAMLAHALRENDVPNAVPGAPKPTPLVGATTAAEGLQTLRATIAQAKEKGGSQGFTKASTPLLDILVTSSHEHMQRMSKGDQDAFFKKSLLFIADKFGGRDNVLTAVIHRDETTAHMQVLVMPFDRTTNRFAASKMIGGPAGLSALQDAFYESCGKPHGMIRGERGSKAKHVPVRRLYAAMAKGEAPPTFVDVPPAPGLADRLRPGYKAKLAAHKEALEKNAAERKRILELAKSGRMMHPLVIEAQADRYRRAVAMETAAKADKSAAVQTLANAASERELITKTKRDIEHATNEIQKQAQSADALWTKAGGQLLDKSSKRWSPEYVQQVSRALGIPLMPGKGVIDQMRAAGRGRTLIESAKILDTVMDGAMTRQIDSGEAQRSIDRQRNT